MNNFIVIQKFLYNRFYFLTILLFFFFLVQKISKYLWILFNLIQPQEKNYLTDTIVLGYIFNGLKLDIVSMQSIYQFVQIESFTLSSLSLSWWSILLYLCTTIRTKLSIIKVSTLHLFSKFAYCFCLIYTVFLIVLLFHTDLLILL